MGLTALKFVEVSVKEGASRVRICGCIRDALLGEPTALRALPTSLESVHARRHIELSGLAAAQHRDPCVGRLEPERAACMHTQVCADALAEVAAGLQVDDALPPKALGRDRVVTPCGDTLRGAHPRDMA